MKNTKKRDFAEVNAEVIRLQAEAAKDPHHPINEGLWAYFEDRKKRLAEIKERETAHQMSQAIFAVDNLKPNPETQHIFKAYTNGEIPTIDEAIKALDTFYGIDRKQLNNKEKP